MARTRIPALWKARRLRFEPDAAALSVVDACARRLAPTHGALSEWHEHYVKNHRVRLAHDLELVLREVPATQSVLEMGSVPLLLTSALSQCGYRVTGCDIAPERYAAALRSSGLNVVKCNIETEPLPFADDSFDAAIFNELFEHLRINPIFTLREVLRVMKPGATLTLSTPNLKSLGGIVNFLVRDKAYSCAASIHDEYRKLADIGHMGHVREYTPTEVAEFLAAIGFEVTSVIFRGEYTKPLARAAISIIPRLSPFVSFLAKKPARA